MRRFLPSFLIIGCLLLSACLPSESILPTETPVPLTHASHLDHYLVPPIGHSYAVDRSTYTATPEMSPGIGSVIFTDDFSNASAWDTAASAQGSAAISRNRLTLAAEPGVYLASMNREAVLGDFYAEITARPSLCRRDDSYGIIIRSTGDSFYRFTLTCNSMISAERIRSSVRLLVQSPTPSGDAPPGAPGEVRIGIWAVGNEIASLPQRTFPIQYHRPQFSKRVIRRLCARRRRHAGQCHIFRPNRV